MLSAEQIDQAAQHLFLARITKTPGELIPEGFRPTDRESAIAIQQRVLALMDETVGGYKCGVPGANGPLVFSPIPASAIWRTSPVVVPLGAKRPPVGLIEPEIAFVLAGDLPAKGEPYSESEILDAIGDAHLVLELITSRYADKYAATPIDLLADSYNNHGLFIGPVIPNVHGRFLEMLQVTITAKYPEEDKVLFDKVGRHPSGHPMKSFAWLVHFLNKNGQGLKTGQVVTTGSYAGIVEAPIGIPLRIELGDVGTLDTALVTAQT
jgi:2-keto-4-pentenoate hydratase